VDLVVETALADLPDDDRERRGLGGEVEQAVAAGRVLRVDLVEPLDEARVRPLVVEVAAVVADALQELLLDGGIERDAGVRAQRRLQLLAERLVVVRPAPDRDEHPVLGQEVRPPELGERRDDLAVRQVASRAEQDHDVRVGHALQPEALAQGIALGRLGRLVALPVLGETLIPDGSTARRGRGGVGAALGGVGPHRSARPGAGRRLRLRGRWLGGHAYAAAPITPS